MNRIRSRAWNAIAILGALCAMPADAQEAPQGSWMVRARAVRIDTADKSDPVPSLGIPSNAITVNNKTIPEIDVTYFFTPNLAAELVLTVPQKQTVTVQQSALGGPVDIGTFKHLPPTLMLQYHFMPEAKIRPYAGVGLNYTRISSVNLFVPTVGPLDLDRNSFGLAVGGGVDIALTKNVFLNFDVKKVQIRTDVTQFGARLSTVKLDPWLFGAGVGYRF
ncbi:MAG: OmpW family protein [Variovorax sp.]|nr:OmpW family protein [Variovorax sp.]